MKRKLIVVAYLILISLFVTTFAQTKQAIDSDVFFNLSSDQDNELYKNLDINVSFGEKGLIEKIRIESNKFDNENSFRLDMQREMITTLMDRLVLVKHRGEKLGKTRKFYFKTGTLEVDLYRKVSIGLTVVCPNHICVVSYAEIKRTN